VTVKETTNDPNFLNYDELDKENARQRLLTMESEMTMEKIKKIVQKLQKTHEDIQYLKSELSSREDNILSSVKRTIHLQIKEIMPSGSENIRLNLEEDDKSDSNSISTISTNK
jgi:DNA-directed RNA polymerase subunit F